MKSPFRCAWCGDQFQRYASQTRGRRVFCGHLCQAAANRRTLNSEDLKHMYLTDRLSAAKIGARFGTSDFVVRERLKEMGIVMRSRGSYILRQAKIFCPSVRLNLPDAERGYLAGFLDGDGTVGLYRRGVAGRFTPSVGFFNTHLPTIDHIARLLGGEGFSRSAAVHCTKFGRCTVYRVDIRSVADCLHVLETIYPYLVTKRQQADIVMRYCRRKLVQAAAGDFSVKPEDWVAWTELRALNGGRVSMSTTAALSPSVN